MTTDKRKQVSVLSMNTLAFTVNFAVWTMFSIIGSSWLPPF
jgi:NNP family nitrate/nitrite transporter-like MFS transporter